jgi:hypothetical protein
VIAKARPIFSVEEFFHDLILIGNLYQNMI